MSIVPSTQFTKITRIYVNYAWVGIENEKTYDIFEKIMIIIHINIIYLLLPIKNNAVFKYK